MQQDAAVTNQSLNANYSCDLNWYTKIKTDYVVNTGESDGWSLGGDVVFLTGTLAQVP